jgi:hypothetical protein
MTEPHSDRSEARREAAILLGVDIEHLSAADGLRVDMVSALRLVIDHEQASVLDGGSADLAKLNIAVQSLIALLPGRELPKQGPRRDPREAMWEIYLEMRRRGEVPQTLQERIAELEAENEQLRAALGGSTAITPPTAVVVPPSEIGECYAGPPPPGPDDPKQSTAVIEGKAVPSSPSPAPQNFDDTEGGRAWQAWADAGGGHYDPWSNRNGV